MWDLRFWLDIHDLTVHISTLMWWVYLNWDWVLRGKLHMIVSFLLIFFSLLTHPFGVGYYTRDWFGNKTREWMFDWIRRTWYSNDLLPTSLSNLRTSTRSDDVNEMLWIVRLNKEYYSLDFIILAYFSLTSRLGRC